MTAISGKQTIYYGPSTAYRKGEVIENLGVDVLWKEGQGWVYGTYQGGGKKKGGYLPVGALAELCTPPARAFTTVVRYILTAGPVYMAPPYEASISNPNGGVLEMIARGTMVTFFPEERPNNYAFIEYISTSGAKARGYFWSAAMSAGVPVNTMDHFQAYQAGGVIAAGLPMSGAKVTQGFNDKTTNNKGHFGYDLKVPGGVVRAILDGTIVATKPTVGTANGRAITISHKVGGETFFSTYCHLASLSKTSGVVARGEAIGVMGGSGATDSTYAPHLHLCVYENSPTVDPFGYCSPAPSGGSHSKTFEQVAAASGYAPRAAYYYGSTSDAQAYPRCGGKRFYDPYGVISTNAALITAHKNSK